MAQLRQLKVMALTMLEPSTPWAASAVAFEEAIERRRKK
jgi:hypothetical protein